MAVSEKNGTGQAMHPAGLYRHKETGEELVLTATSKFGNPQADAATRLGFEYVGEAPKGTPEVVDPHAQPLATPMGTETVAELQVRLAEAKAREAEAMARLAEAQKADKRQTRRTAKETVEREEAAQEQAEAQTKSQEKKEEAQKTLNETKEAK